jgi:hypothetical protein
MLHNLVGRKAAPLRVLILTVRHTAQVSDNNEIEALEEEGGDDTGLQLLIRGRGFISEPSKSSRNEPPDTPNKRFRHIIVRGKRRHKRKGREPARQGSNKTFSMLLVRSSESNAVRAKQFTPRNCLADKDLSRCTSLGVKARPVTGAAACRTKTGGAKATFQGAGATSPVSAAVPTSAARRLAYFLGLQPNATTTEAHVHLSKRLAGRRLRGNARLRAGYREAFRAHECSTRRTLEGDSASGDAPGAQTAATTRPHTAHAQLASRTEALIHRLWRRRGGKDGNAACNEITRAACAGISGDVAENIGTVGENTSGTVGFDNSAVGDT